MLVSTPSYMTGCCLWSFLVECVVIVFLKFDIVYDAAVVLNKLCKYFLNKSLSFTCFSFFDNRGVVMVLIRSTFVCNEKDRDRLTAVIETYLLL